MPPLAFRLTTPLPMPIASPGPNESLPVGDLAADFEPTEWEGLP